VFVEMFNQTLFWNIVLMGLFDQHFLNDSRLVDLGGFANVKTGRIPNRERAPGQNRTDRRATDSRTGALSARYSWAMNPAW